MEDLKNIKLSTHEAAAYLDMSPGTLENWRIIGKGPSFYKPSGKVYYIKADLDNWIDQGRVAHDNS